MPTLVQIGTISSSSVSSLPIKPVRLRKLPELPLPELSKIVIRDTYTLLHHVVAPTPNSSEGASRTVMLQEV